MRSEPLNLAYIVTNGIIYACAAANDRFSIARPCRCGYRGSGFADNTVDAGLIVIAYDRSGNHPDIARMDAVCSDGHAEGARPDGAKQPSGWTITNCWERLMKTARFTLPELITVVLILALVIIMFGAACASGMQEKKKRVFGDAPPILL